MPKKSDTIRASSEAIAEAIKGEILDGILAPGSRIGQDALAVRFGTSRLPARDALRLLEAEGLVNVIPYRGARVTNLDPWELDQTYMIRLLIEPHALRQSGPNLTAENLAELQSLQEQMASTADVTYYLELDKRFHLLSYAGVAYQPLFDMCERFWNATERYRRVYISKWAPPRIDILNAEHLLMVECLQRGDAESAANHLIAHYRRPQQWLAANTHVLD